MNGIAKMKQLQTQMSEATPQYRVPLRLKYPDIEMLIQKPKISRDVQNMMPKIITYRSRPKKRCKSSSSLFDEIICNEIFDGKINSKSKIFDDITN